LNLLFAKIDIGLSPRYWDPCLAKVSPRLGCGSSIPAALVLPLRPACSLQFPQ